MATQTFYGTTKDGQDVHQFVLKNKSGMEMRCLNYGCRLTNLFVPAPNGEIADVVLGYEQLADYEADPSSQGAFVGRYAGRIRGAGFTLNGQQYSLSRNDHDKHFMHGSCSKKVFNAEIIGENSITFTYVSPDGEDGFPGELWISVTYTLTDENELVFDTRAVSQKDTHVNFTNHSFFNLSGRKNNIENHILWLNSRSFLEIDEECCPTGRIVDCAGGAFDFSTEKVIGQEIDKDDPQLNIVGGYNHCFVLNRQRPANFVQAAVLQDPESKRRMHVYTTQPGLQVYTGNALDGTQIGKYGFALLPRGGICFEAMHYPNSPNEESFPSTLLTAKEKYHHTTIFKF